MTAELTLALSIDRARDALLVIDLQLDFMPGGALAVAEGDQVVAPIAALLPRFQTVVATQDWHPAEHISFAARHGLAPFATLPLYGGDQTLWPVHCVQNTGGALFAPGLDSRRIHRVFTKGMNPLIDSYSGLYDNGHKGSTGMG